jgi:zinc transporter ZupT
MSLSAVAKKLLRPLWIGVAAAGGALIVAAIMARLAGVFDFVLPKAISVFLGAMIGIAIVRIIRKAEATKEKLPRSN